MADHVTEWLGAYHDGELHGAHLRQVEQHLTGCAACRAELDEIRTLSALLQDTPPNGVFLPTERFAANLALRLPRQPEQPEPRKTLIIGWWLIPFGLLGIWLFFNITLWLSSAAALAANTDLFDGYSAWQHGFPLQMGWFAAAMDLFGVQFGAPGQIIFAILNDVHLFVTQLAGILIPQAVLAVSYLGWLGSWWLRHQSQPTQFGGSVPQS